MATKRILAALLASLMLIPAMAACSDDSGKTADTSASAETTVPAETEPRETERHEIKDDLPADLRFDGKSFGIYIGTKAVYESFYAGAEEKAGDVVIESVWERNANVEERMGAKLNMVSYDVNYKGIAGAISTLILAGDSTYDIYLGSQWGVTSLVAQRMFVNGFELPHVNYDQPWWMNSFMDEISLGKDYRFLLASDYNTQTIAYARALFFNKTLYEKIYGDPNELYKEALDGKWTLDRLNTLVSGAYSDLDGNGTVDTTDQLGFITNQLNSTTDGFVYGSEVAFTTRDKDGFIQLNMVTDEAIALLDKLNAFFHQTAVNIKSGGKEVPIFAEGNSLFLGNATLNNASGLRDMEDDFGYLPNPKIYDTQEGYHSVVHDTHHLTGVSITSKDLAFTGAMLEALAAESYRRVTPAWYESALKLKYARDDISSQMIDMIKDSLSTNFIFAYSPALNNIGQVYRGLITNKSTDYVSTVQSKLPAAETALADLIKAFKGQ